MPVNFSLSCVKVSPYHLNFMGQILGWARIASSCEKKMAKSMAFFLLLIIYWIHLFPIILLCFISYTRLFLHMKWVDLKHMLLLLSGPSCSYHCWCKCSTNYSMQKYEIKWASRDNAPFYSIEKVVMKSSVILFYI